MSSLTYYYLHEHIKFETDENIRSYPIFFETGTCTGCTIFAMERYFSQLYTVEIKDDLFWNLINNYKSNKIKFYFGDSSIILKEKVESLNNNTIFFLDGHYSHCGTGRGEKDCPLLEELEAIMEKFKHEAIIIINDFRLFGKGPKKGGFAEDWEDISKEKVLEIVKSRLKKSYHCPSKYAPNDRLILHIKKRKPSTAIIISSTKKCAYIWITFFSLLFKHWSDCEYPIFFTSDDDENNNLEKLKNKFNINILKLEKDLGFMPGYEYILNNIKDKYTNAIFLQDDFLIEKKVDSEFIKKCVKIMESDSNIGYIRLMPCPGPKGKKIKYGDITLGEIRNNGLLPGFSFSNQAAIYNIEFLSKIISKIDYNPIEHPFHKAWGFERELTKKLEDFDNQLLGFIRKSPNANSVYDSPIPYRPTAIVGGKLEEWAKKLLVGDVREGFDVAVNKG